MTNVSEWSVTAGLNNSSPPDGWPEGMARSAVNDCAREMMAAIAKWYQDARASLVTAGTSDAYTLTSNNTYASLSAIPPLYFTANRANVSTSVTLNVDGLGAKTWYKRPGKYPWGVGEIIANSAYGVVYNSTLDAFETISVPTRAFTPKGHLFGMTLSNSVGDLVNDISIATGVCTSDDGLDTMELGSAIIKRLDSGWAVGTNQGGIDAGAAADGTYHMYAIKRPDTGVVDVLFSTNASSPTMPINYTLKRRIGSIVRLAGTIKAFTQEADEFLWLVQAKDQDEIDLNATADLITLTVPTGLQVWAMLLIQISHQSGGPHFASFTSPDQTDSAPDDTTRTVDIPGGETAWAHGRYRTNTSGQFRVRGESGITYVTDIVTRGWIDDRGRSS